MAKDVVEALQPQPLWSLFKQLSEIPRPSKHEEQVLNFLKNFAKEHQLSYKQDDTGNLVILRPGSGGGESAPTIVIQGHVDMVTEKNSSVVHDFNKDPLKLVRNGDWLKADGTTLGADNGIGVCAALALLTSPPTAKLPPLECLFTVDEETGLTGAFQLDGSIVTGRTMLNLDTEDWGEIFIGCAGGGDSLLTLPLEQEPCSFAGQQPLQLTITGLMGGHSGLNIGEGRGNAILMAVQVLQAVLGKVEEARLMMISGGDKRNALARECRAALTVPIAQKELAKAVASQQIRAIKQDYQNEASISASLVEASQGQTPQAVLTLQSQQRLLKLLQQLPHGAIKYSEAVPGLVETSSNLAAVSPAASSSSSQVEYQIICSTRSSIGPELEKVRAQIAAAAQEAGANAKQDEAYPGWNPDPSSKVLQVVKQVFVEILGKEPKVGAIHAGLECGIIGERCNGMDMVSFGPTIKGAHSPDEAVNILTVEPFWNATLEVLKRLAEVEC
ncbi:hypothetical protein WJX74_001245 [Apatococcus lobatus]|uniref:Peptidase M20 dimerisation domain-containing protein n=1 Tax=Apatococcus lobatus TaxID=904363 RepID=A0AAW1Q9C7_9CHLO